MKIKQKESLDKLIAFLDKREIDPFALDMADTPSWEGHKNLIKNRIKLIEKNENTNA